MRISSTSKRSESGSALIMFTLMVFSVLLPMVGLAIDGGRAYVVRLKLSSAVDGGSLAAARLLGTGATSTEQLNNATATAKQFVAANFPAGFFGANVVGSATICVDPGTDTSDPCKVGNGGNVSTYKVRTVAVSATAKLPLLFMGFIGFPTVTVASSGVASRRDVRVVLAMDRSSSMNAFYTGIGANPPSINDMATKFVKSFSGSTDFGGRDELGLVVFGGSGIVAYPPRDITKDYTDYTQFTPPDSNFKVKAGGNIVSFLADLNSHNSNTGTAEALYLSYMALRADATTNTDLATKLNVIVLFTDGIPNGVTAFANDPHPLVVTQMMKSGCKNTPAKASNTVTPVVSSANKNMIGWFAQHGGSKKTDFTGAFGLGMPMMGYAYSGSQGTKFNGQSDDIDAYMQDADGDLRMAPQISPPPPPNTNTGTESGCPSTAGVAMTSIKQFPDYDLYGNYTDLSLPGASAVPTGSTGKLYENGSLYKNAAQCNKMAYDATAVTNSCQIALASWQAAAHQGWKIWNQIIWDQKAHQNIADPAANQSQPIIFTIGFDHSWDGTSEKPDLVLLQLIANDPLSPAPFSTRIQGKAFLASDANAVDNAFQQIASEILRLSQ
jgi:Flp pilus assembly protein TadG